MPKEPGEDGDWIREWNETQDHRYDAYWLGRIHPFYRRAAAMGTSVSFGVALTVAGLLLGAAAAWRPPPDFRIFFAVLAALFVLLGISNIRAARSQARAPRYHEADDPRRHPGHDPCE